MKSCKYYILSILTLAFPMYLSSQSYADAYRKLVLYTDSILEKQPTELCYIQTTKDIYETGEDLWFKVYVLDKQFLTPSLLSRTLYLQLINEKSGKISWKEKYEINQGLAEGKVLLGSDLAEGDYLIEAFTPNSFFNDSSEFKSVRKVKVKADILATSGKTEKLNTSSGQAGRHQPYKVQFNTFPEGGNLVYGLKCRLAFKAVKPDGQPADIKGTLFENGAALLEFSSQHAGMGVFSFTPVKGNSYIIKLLDASTDTVYQLPAIKPEGYSISLEGRDKEHLYFSLSESERLENSKIFIRVQCRGIDCGFAGVIARKDLKIKIPVKELPQGIAEITVFNNNLLPIAERLVYINNEERLYVTAEPSKSIYPTRGKVTVRLKVNDHDGKPVQANLGVTVFDKLYQDSAYTDNIMAHLFLTEQLRGRIFNPSYYFEEQGQQQDYALDLLMLTQGWRSYTWNDLNITYSVDSHVQIISDGIDGEVDHQGNRRKPSHEQLFIIAFSPNIDSSKMIIPTDNSGHFLIPPERLKEWENDYVYLKPFGPYQSLKAKKTWDPLASPEYNFTISLSDPYKVINSVLKKKTINYPLAAIPDAVEKYLLPISENGVIMIPDVTIKGGKSKPVRGKYLGTLDSIMKLQSKDDYVCRYGVLNCPRHDRNEPGTTIPQQGHSYFVIIDYNTPGERTKSVTYWSPVYSEEELLKVNNLSRGKAYYGHRQFYQPYYDKDSSDIRIPDFRNTLYWNPEVKTDANGEAEFSFFCSDINSEFVGRIEGVSDEGLAGAGSFKFVVRKLNLSYK
jgi:hypothetical protein